MLPMTSFPTGTPSPGQVLFVCRGNICRSPAALAIFNRMVAEQGLQERLRGDSCGTASFARNRPLEPRMAAGLKSCGYELPGHQARQIEHQDYQRSHCIMAMDRVNLSSVKAWAPPEFDGHLGLLLDHHPEQPADRQVPDPFYQDEAFFRDVIRLLEQACRGLISALASKAGMTG